MVESEMESETETEQHRHTFEKLQCGPMAPQDKNYSCLSDRSLHHLKELWNSRHPDAKITTTEPKAIWTFLAHAMRETCNRESCWLKQKFVEGKLDHELKDAYSPVSPKSWEKKPNTWLTSTDIMKVMRQYEKAYHCFEFMGPSPIDFDTRFLYKECVWEELCKFNLAEQIARGKTKIGMIFNTDTHDKDGSHWISMFVNIKKRHIFFFDSVGSPAPKEVMALVERIQAQGRAMQPPLEMVFDQNHPVEHQYKNTECGIYSLFFIVHMLQDRINGEYLKTHILKDKYMESFRKVYFNRVV